MWIDAEEFDAVCLNGLVRVFFVFLRAKHVAIKRGHQAIPKSECRRWSELVKHGYAQEAGDYIRLRNLTKSRFVRKVQILESWLTLDAMTVAAYVVQGQYLNIAGLAGRTKHTRKRNRRLLLSPDVNGMALSVLAARFKKTKAWASGIRKKMEAAGLCSYKARFEEVTASEVQAARLVGEGHRYVKRGGVCLRQRVSECTVLVPVTVKRWRLTKAMKTPKFSGSAYSERKGRS